MFVVIAKLKWPCKQMLMKPSLSCKFSVSVYWCCVIAFFLLFYCTLLLIFVIAIVLLCYCVNVFVSICVVVVIVKLHDIKTLKALCLLFIYFIVRPKVTITTTIRNLF